MPAHRFFTAVSITCVADISHAQPHTMPAQIGQASFAAISEVIEILENNPHTNWKTANIDALRSHLNDMNLVMTKAAATTNRYQDHVTFEITGQADVIPSVQQMTMAHAQVLTHETEWTVIAKPNANGAILTLKSNDTVAIEKIAAMGFLVSWHMVRIIRLITSISQQDTTRIDAQGIIPFKLHFSTG